jgi:ATP-dependent protease HslVU (ClpYQ) peptidase subunit
MSKDQRISVEQMILGCAGSVRLSQLLKYVPQFEAYNENDDDVLGWLAVSFTNSIKEAFDQANLTKIENNQAELDGLVLIGIRGRLFYMQPDFSFIESNRTYEAIGSGDEYALGAMFAVESLKKKLKDKVAEEDFVELVLKTGIEAACEHSPSCSDMDEILKV